MEIAVETTTFELLPQSEWGFTTIVHATVEFFLVERTRVVGVRREFKSSRKYLFYVENKALREAIERGDQVVAGYTYVDRDERGEEPSMLNPMTMSLEALLNTLENAGILFMLESHGVFS